MESIKISLSSREAVAAVRVIGRRFAASIDVGSRGPTASAVGYMRKPLRGCPEMWVMPSRLTHPTIRHCPSSDRL